MTWLLAGLVAGVVSGAVTWLIGVFYKSLYTGGLINELTVFAAFTALLVFLGGISGVTVGRYLIDRAGAYTPQRGGGGEEDRADTDVFAAVRSDEAAAAEGGAWPEEQSSAVATAEREDHGSPEAYSEEPAYSEEKTQKIAWPPKPKTETTEAIPTHETAEHTEEFPTEAEHTEPTAKRDED
jgi:hypothetical protein